MVDHSKNIVYLITGANRGIGLALVHILSTRPNTTIIPTARSLPSSSSSSSSPSPFVDSITTPHPSSSIIPTLLDDSNPPISSSTLPSRLSTDFGITHLDVVIANAGAATNGFKSVFDTTEEDYRADFEVNTLGPIRLFKAVRGLLEQGGKGGKFVVVGSSVGSIGGLTTPEGEMEGGLLTCGSYGVSKAGVQWWVMKLRAEVKMQGGEGVVVGVVHPGWVKTQMGQGLADAVGFEGGPPLSVEESARGVVEQVDKLTMENSGQFWRWDGGVLPW